MRTLLLFLVLCIVPLSLEAQALGVRYFHCDTLNISPAARDTTWDDPWEVATIYADTVNVDLKVGAPDYGSWASRHTFYLESGMALTIGPTPNLKRLRATTRSGTGVLYIIGYKKVRQY